MRGGSEDIGAFSGRRSENLVHVASTKIALDSLLGQKSQIGA